MSRAAIVFSILLATRSISFSQDTVTIPKSRFEELERKEAELESLKGGRSNSTSAHESIAKRDAEGVAKVKSVPTPEPSPARDIPPVSTLQPLAANEVVEALDLENHYQSDNSAAGHRYRNQTFKLRGEVVAFEKPMLTRDYKILLKTADRKTRLVCDIYPPEKFSAVFTIKVGSELVGQLPDRTRLPIVKIGDIAVIEGRCKGIKDSVIRMSACELK